MIGTMGIPVMTIKPGTELPLRHELKHRINLREDLVLSQRLRKLFPHDKNAGPGGTYRVTSLYFDTPYDSALREKIDGVNRREKFRLRYYGMDTSFIRLEKKYKINGLCGKRSARMTQEQADQILDLINATTAVYGYDESILNIISDEAAAYFAGEKSLDDTANMIQSRVNLYVAEQS